MRISFWIVLCMAFSGFYSSWTSASPISLHSNNAQAVRMLSKRNVYFQKVEELLSQVSILQLRVQHIQTELQEIKQTTSGRKECADNSASQMSCCNENVLQELDTAIQNLREELGQERAESGELSVGVESLREGMEEYSYKVDDVKASCQKSSLKITACTSDIVNMNATINEMESRFSEEVENIKKCMEDRCGTTSRRSIRPPSFISQWFHMKAFESKLSKVIIEHGLNELPAKVDVQVKSVSGADNDWIFTGASVYHGEDDTGEDYGGVVYLYNATHVILTAPMPYNNDLGQGYVVTTGHRNNYFIGSHHYRYIEGLVRVRIWLLNTFPTPSYTTQWYALNVADKAKSFHALRHGLSSYPAYVVVQVKSENMISEAAGSSLLANGQHSNTGGACYGVDERMVRIWTAYYINSSSVFSGKLFGSGWDGWAGWDTFRLDTSQWTLGEFRVTVWDSESFDRRNFLIRESNVMETQTGALSMPEIDIDNDLVSFYAQGLDGPNQGFLFSGWGSSKAVFAPFGGVIYAYNKQGQFQTWRPNPDKQGYLININSPYGNGRNIQSSNSASYVAKLLKAET